MIYTYGFSLQGTYHIKNNIVCQDAYKIEKCDEDMIIAAVADGLGSEEHSDIASKIAARNSTDYCKQHILATSTAEEILDIIKASFFEAQQEIEKTAAAQNHDINQYDTTLTLAVLVSNTLYFGHSGDSGIVALTTEGTYEKVTIQQRDEDNCVFPLFFEEKWVFDQFDKDVCSVLLATDGMLETLFPSLIKNEAVSIHVNLAKFFIDNQSLSIDKEGEVEVQKRIEAFVKSIPDEQVNDDKTIVVLVNASVEANVQPADYYAEPDWADLKRKHDEEWKRLAYPHLFKADRIEALHARESVEATEQCEYSKTNIDEYPQTTNDILREPAHEDSGMNDMISDAKNEKGGTKRFFKK